MIQTTVPAWFWLVAVAVAAGYAGALYYRNRKDELSKGWKTGLAAIRFLFVFLICFLLMSPIAKMKQEQVQKPLCFVAVDDSRSMRAALAPEYRNKKEADTAVFSASGFAQDIEQQTNRLCEELSERFQVQRLAFGKEVRQEKYSEAQESAHSAYAQEATDYARLFQDMAQRLSASTVSKARYRPTVPARSRSIASVSAIPFPTRTSSSRNAASIPIRFWATVFRCKSGSASSRLPMPDRFSASQKRARH